MLNAIDILFTGTLLTLKRLVLKSNCDKKYKIDDIIEKEIIPIPPANNKF